MGKIGRTVHGTSVNMAGSDHDAFIPAVHAALANITPDGLGQGNRSPVLAGDGKHTAHGVMVATEPRAKAATLHISAQRSGEGRKEEEEANLLCERLQDAGDGALYDGPTSKTVSTFGRSHEVHII
jgi:hypothetical protein